MLYLGKYLGNVKLIILKERAYRNMSWISKIKSN